MDQKPFNQAPSSDTHCRILSFCVMRHSFEDLEPPCGLIIAHLWRTVTECQIVTCSGHHNREEQRCCLEARGLTINIILCSPTANVGWIMIFWWHHNDSSYAGVPCYHSHSKSISKYLSLLTFERTWCPMEDHRRVDVVTGRRAREMVVLFNYSVIKGLSFRVMRKQVLEEVNIVCCMGWGGFPIKLQTLIMPFHHCKILEPGDSSACILGKVFFCLPCCWVRREAGRAGGSSGTMEI